MPEYSPDELKAIILHYGSVRSASEKLGVSSTQLSKAANADITQSGYTLSEESTDRIYQRTRRYSDSTKQEIRLYRAMLRSIEDHPKIKRALMNIDKHETHNISKLFTKYRNRLDEHILWTKIMGKLYDRYGWQKGHWSR